MNGRIVIDVTNDFDPNDLKGRTSSEVWRTSLPVRAS